MLASWGVVFPWDLDALPGAMHHHRGGMGTFLLPPESELLEFAGRSATRKSAHPVLIVLGHLLLFSQHAQPDVVRLLARLQDLDPVATHPTAAEEWDDIWTLASAAFEARHHTGAASL